MNGFSYCPILPCFPVRFNNQPSTFEEAVSQSKEIGSFVYLSYLDRSNKHYKAFAKKQLQTEVNPLI